MSVLAWFTILVSGCAAAYAAYLAYPRIEAAFLRKINAYLDWVSSTSERMFLPLNRRNVAIAIAVFTAAMSLLGFFITFGNGWVTLLFTLLFGWLGWSAVRFWIAFQWQKRIRKFDLQLIDGLNLLANSLKSGLNLSQAIQVLVQEMPKPLSQEFGLVLSQEKIGLSLDEALEKMLDRVPSEDLSVAVHSILILRETGGDLSETFEVIASTIRERRKVDGKIKAMTAQGKMQGLVLFLMPFGVGFMLYLVSPEYISPLFTTQLGWILVIIMLFFQIIGGLWLRKIVQIDV